ncbi:uncharacterized protein METZ01_LOCUS388384 [marine metagenome]|uniref:Uncharacterized protein n=1 Tax=marine metagenome TaxID=408172 RepID=A0A382UMV4_9ZZZZ
MNRACYHRIIRKYDSHCVSRVFDIPIGNIESPANGSFAAPTTFKKRPVLLGFGTEFMALPKETRQTPSPRTPHRHLQNRFAKCRQISTTSKITKDKSPSSSLRKLKRLDGI